MSKKDKIIKVLEILIDQHERMFDGHKVSSSVYKDKILEVDEKFVRGLKDDLNSVHQDKYLDDLYLKYKDQILLRKL